jgi:pimeloyl-ACP methyl ester carboxylesterase
MRMLAFLGLLAALGGGAAPTGAQEHSIGTNCAVPGVAFAPCPDTQRLFKTIVVGVPGWNGKCDNSFGVQVQNVLNVMREPSFFDVDCFDYDSHGMTLEKTVDLLRTHLQDLKLVYGYEEVSFITHSTGGVVVLRLLLDELRAADGVSIRTGADRSFLFRTDGGSLRVRGVFAWGIPINGVRPHVCNAGIFANLFQVSPAVLPHLCADSPFLLDLKKQYEAMNAEFERLPSASRAGLGFELIVFQGQDDDWVVHPVLPGESWVPRNARVQLVDTQAPHTSAISSNGTVELPTFAGLTMRQVSQLSFSLMPRTGDYFRGDLAASETLERAQTGILDGVVDFSSIGNLFLAGSREVSDFALLIFNQRFVRSPTFDAYAVDKLDMLMRAKVEQLQAEDAVRYADTLLFAIDRGFQTVNTTDLMAFGGKNKEAVRKLVMTVANVFGAVKQLLDRDPGLEDDLISSGSVAEFERRVSNVIERLLQDEDQETRSLALAALQDFVSLAAPVTVANFDFEGTFEQYGRANYNMVTATEKEMWGDALLVFASRSPEARARSLQFLNERSPFIGQDAPMWAPLLSGEQLRQFVEADDQSLNQSAWPTFLGSVIGEAGLWGQPAALGYEAIERFRPLLQDADPVQVGPNEAIFVDGLNRTQFPAVRTDGIELLNDLNLSGALSSLP